MTNLTIEDAITLLLAEQIGIAKLEPHRKRQAILVLNDRVFDLDRNEVQEQVKTPVGEIGLSRSADLNNDCLSELRRLTDRLKDAEERHKLTRQALALKPGMALASSLENLASKVSEMRAQMSSAPASSPP